jgi:hypothetical protein
MAGYGRGRRGGDGGRGDGPSLHPRSIPSPFPLGGVEHTEGSPSVCSREGFWDGPRVGASLRPSDFPLGGYPPGREGVDGDPVDPFPWVRFPLDVGVVLLV